MIYTCTFNPALDYKFSIDEVVVGGLNRIKNEYFEVGGKGIMVSKLLSNLNVNSTALGFLAGFVGRYIHDELKNYPNITDSFTEVEGNSRINMKMKHTQSETEINGSGPVITEQSFDSLLSVLDSLSEEDYFVMSGSAPNGIPDAYERIANHCNGKQSNYVIDTSGEQLIGSLKCNPFLVKPNKQEMMELFSLKNDDVQTLVGSAKELLRKGAKNVLLSLGGEGAIFVNNEYTLKIAAPKGTVKSTIGSGDSMVAGFVAKYIETKDIKEAFKFSVACGSATAFSKVIAKEEEINELYKIVEIEEIE